MKNNVLSRSAIKSKERRKVPVVRVVKEKTRITSRYHTSPIRPTVPRPANRVKAQMWFSLAKCEFLSIYFLV